MSVKGVLQGRDCRMRRVRCIRGLGGMVGQSLAILAIVSFLTGCYRTRLGDPTHPAIMHRPPPMQFQRGPLAELPRYDPQSGKGWQVDVRSCDLGRLDLRTRLADLKQASFDSLTRWPDRLPDGFDPKAILQLNRNPGLGVRRLHARGITGRGVGIGMIDQTLLVDHWEYRDQLRSYEEIHVMDRGAQMHGPAVASIAVGRTVGVAPGANLYYVAETHGRQILRSFRWDFQWVARSIDRLLAINASLPAAQRIRVITITVGWTSSRPGGAAADAAVARATAAGIFVISTGLERTHGLAFHGLGRDSMSDPDLAASYGPGVWWAAKFLDGSQRFEPGIRLLVPMDCRTVASPTGPEDYVYYPEGGWSWAVPWIAGLYALACEVDPGITPERFWAEALATGRTIELQHNGEKVTFGTVADPVGLIERLQAKRTVGRTD